MGIEAGYHLALMLRSATQCLPARLGRSFNKPIGNDSIASYRGFCAAVGVPKTSTSFGSRLMSFATGFTIASTLAGYTLFFKVHETSEELSAMVRDAAARQA